MSRDTWEGAILGAVLGTLIIPAVLKLIQLTQQWWFWSRPPRKVLGKIAKQEEVCKIFVRDLIKEQNAKVLSITPRVGVAEVPNVHELWPDVEGRSVAYILNMFGEIGKTKNINIVKMSEDQGE